MDRAEQPLSFQFPKDDQRVLISGRTGSGKTVFGMWLLSKSSLDTKPWFIFDYKLDEHLNAIQNTIDFNPIDRLPKKPGLYHVHPEENEDTPQIVDLLYRIKRRGNIGLYIDEGYSIPQGSRGGPFRSLMTQGRSLSIPIITITQRPVWIDKFAISEADYFAVFQLNQKSDRKRIEEMIPEELGGSSISHLDTHHCIWYDVPRNWSCELSPAPPPEKSIAAIDARLKPKKRWL